MIRQPGDREKITVILVEDNDDDAVLISAELKKHGFALRRIADGESALQQLKELPVLNPQTPIILLDYKLPRLDGLEVLRRLTESGADLPVVFLTIDSAVDTAIAAMRLGASDFHPKYRGYEELPLILRKVSAMYQERVNRAIFERELISAKDAAEEANAVKSKFLANMSHELRTPLNGMLGMLNLTMATTLTEEQREMLTMARTSADSLLEIVNKLLNFSQIERGMFVPSKVLFSVNRLVNNISRLFAAKAAEKHLELICTCSDAIPDKLVGDERGLGQILFNLVENAIKFSSSGTVEVAASLKHAGETTCMVCFSVSDEGPGIPEDKLPFIFESFRQADENYSRAFGGLGLGLSIVAGIVRSLNGMVSAKNNPGSGTVFTVELPLLLQREAMKDAPLARELYKILVAEDDLVNRKIIEKMLESKGYSVALTIDGAQALERWQAESFDLVLLDMKMPVMDGWEAAREIRRLEKGGKKRTPIISVTAFAFDDDKRRSYDAGIDYHIDKPIDPELLFESIALLLPSHEERKLGHNLTGKDITEFMRFWKEAQPMLVRAVDRKTLAAAAEVVTRLKEHILIRGCPRAANLSKMIEKKLYSEKWEELRFVLRIFEQEIELIEKTQYSN